MKFEIFWIICDIGTSLVLNVDIKIRKNISSTTATFSILTLAGISNPWSLWCGFCTGCIFRRFFWFCAWKLKILVKLTIWGISKWVIKRRAIGQEWNVQKYNKKYLKRYKSEGTLFEICSFCNFNLGSCEISYSLFTRTFSYL